MKEKILKGKKVYLRYPKASDFEEFIELNKSSVDFHKGLINPPKNKDAFDEFFAKNEQSANESFFICSVETYEIAGSIGLSQIFRGGFQNAYLGYYLGEKFAGRCFSTEAIQLIVKFAFEVLKLHRIEANIQPHNFASIAVVKKNGFAKEGFSPKYLNIDGIWCDHERWAIINENWSSEK
jgi:ribosomal-protein-alanine N-acetyltransferase